MKLTNHPPAKIPTVAPHDNFPLESRRVAVEFLPHFDWTIEVVTSGSAGQPRHHHSSAGHAANCRALGLAPIELVIDAANKKATRRRWTGRAQLWAGSAIK